MKFDMTINNYLKKNLYNTKSKRGKLEYFLKIGKDVKNKSAVKIKIGNEKYAITKVMKITEDGIVNNLKI